MNLLKVLKNNLFFQNIAASLIALIPPYLENSLAKYLALKKAFYISAHDKTEGSYLEFGVFTGSSFNFAIKANKKIEKIFGDSNCEFIGFDSFRGFGEINKEDQNPSFQNKTFFINEKKVIKNIENKAKGQKFRLIKGYYQDTIKNKTTTDLNIGKCRVVMLDCDLKESTKLALEFIKPSIQEGTILIFDDYLYYKGSIEKGECGAFLEFQNKYPKIKFRRCFDYGYSGRAFIVNKIH